MLYPVSQATTSAFHLSFSATALLAAYLPKLELSLTFCQAGTATMLYHHTMW